MAEQTSDPVLRNQGVCRELGLTKSPYYLLRALPEDDPERFPDPDGFLNGGRTPVWLLSTVNRYKAAMLARSKQQARERAEAAKREATRKARREAAAAKARRQASATVLAGEAA